LRSPGFSGPEAVLALGIDATTASFNVAEPPVSSAVVTVEGFPISSPIRETISSRAIQPLPVARSQSTASLHCARRDAAGFELVFDREDPPRMPALRTE
jgi:hypothetical protein